MVDGIQLGMFNISGQVITLTAVSVRVMQTVTLYKKRPKLGLSFN
ncbi:hypothetical protein ECBP1_0071 [Escherichia phage ECBP1]|uniref:Uncharacterized protein n=1 Tax=Escherichia phage ECBP1 TaxID=1604356 RepID=J9RVR3_9CAUD|nr:hypothetical protein ECBP1_0071 [Escherichia phage ECBP1]AFR52022.1 hypothetical protein ECBP1_0071 [Escherichia phage ECBP1]